MLASSVSADRRLFRVAAAVIAVAMLVGFARNYYFRIWLGTRPITFMVHVHGLIMTAWAALFLTQVALVARRQVDLHRKLGTLGAILATLIVPLGIYTIARSIDRQVPDADWKATAELFVAFDGLSLLLFGALVGMALSLRRRTEVHKRLMLMAIVSLLPPAYSSSM